MSIFLLFLKFVLRIISKLNLTIKLIVFYDFLFFWFSVGLLLLFEYDGSDKPDSYREQSVTYYFVYHKLKFNKRNLN